MDPNHFNFVLPPYQISFPTFMCYNPYFYFPLGPAQQENPFFHMKIQAEVMNKSLKTSGSEGSDLKDNKSSKKQPKSKQQLNIRKNNTVQQYNDFNKNVFPNNIHLILSYVRRINKSGNVVEKIIDKLSPNPLLYSMKKFFSYQSYLKQKLVNIKHNHMIEAIITYNDPKSQVFSLEQQQFYNKVSRILILNFLRDGALLNVLSSSKIIRTKKDQHLKIQRFIMQKMGAQK